LKSGRNLVTKKLLRFIYVSCYCLSLSQGYLMGWSCSMDGGKITRHSVIVGKVHGTTEMGGQYSTKMDHKELDFVNPH